ncbi:male accessory gland serine protease inhibitor [Drosophila teissieri]|uniref:male accessory gland serine protease inhibitor n=1 Tax=Drosophila teissieri TaxID=7243 RepID=UPI001CB9DE63|nr:male accessory gland serine protease inhibitor [Drosophila teissieri]
MRLVVFGCLLLAVEIIGLCLKDPICGEPPAQNGINFITCAGSFEKFSYHPQTRSCQKFDYGGCFGNANSFDSLHECEEKCKLDNDYMNVNRYYCPYTWSRA